MNTPTAQAQRHIAASLLAAAWRENLANIRNRAQHHAATLTIALPHATLTTTATARDFDQITIDGDIHINNTTITDPASLLHHLHPHPPPHAISEINDAVTGLSTALNNDHHATHITQIAQLHRATTTTALAAKLRHQPDFLPCRFYEPLVTRGHHLHPMARTRLGWSTTDKNQYDLETRQPTRLRVIAIDKELVDATPDPHGQHLDTLLARDAPAVTEALSSGDHHLVPVHPWQHQHVLRHRHAEAFNTGRMFDTGVTIAAFPTSSVRTLVTLSGNYLKCSLDIQITSTRRGISPATVHNGPLLSPIISDIIANDPVLDDRVAILPEHAGISLHSTHPHSRDASCILRGKLTDTLQPHEQAVPATALAATSPLTQEPILLEILREYAAHIGTTARAAAPRFLRLYADRLVPAAIVLASRYGIGIEGHLQNCIPTFTAGEPCRILLRDLGGARLFLPALHNSGHHPELHPDSVITAPDLDVMRNKVIYTVFQNHLAELVHVLDAQAVLSRRDGWDIITEVLTGTDAPSEFLAAFRAPTVPHKALLTMRLTNGNDRYVPVANPMYRT
ncbi:MAG TPA: hypothetical protein H9902_07090 [Candidatus Stackebrandtia faecavium]|nr:hypothetical protein [Candidatus Stackebrandtia faecavium]